MKPITIHLSAVGNTDKQINGKVAAMNAPSIERAIMNAKKEINLWLMFGDAHIDVTDDATGEVVASGLYTYNAFAGRGNMVLKMTA